jgi:glutamine---fructose-6-phosphate transaminase (isomerizing)
MISKDTTGMETTRSKAQESATLQEILTQPQAWKASLSDFKGSRMLQTILEQTSSRTEWLFVGCGTSFYLAEAAAASWTILSGQTARALPASEILLFSDLNLQPHRELQAVVISRSGTTSEAVRAASLLRRKHNIATLGVTCSPNSPLESACELTIQLSSAQEKSIVMTRSFTSMLLVLQYLAGCKKSAEGFCASLEKLAGSLEASLLSFSDRVNSFTKDRTFVDYIFLAQGPFLGIAHEAALKVAEMSCSFSQSYHTLEFRHGPKAIVGPETCLTFFISESGQHAECEMLAEMKEIGGVVVIVCNRANKRITASSDLVFEMGLDVPEIATLAASIVPGQLLGCYTGLKKGLNPDAPKNLSRVVLLD